MMRLFLVEVRRFSSRRAMRIVAGALLGLIVVAGSLTFAFSNRDFAGAAARERAQLTADFQACLADTADDPQLTCDPPKLESVQVDPRFHLSSLPEVFAGIGANLIILALAFGASFIGAEWHHRTMTSTLLWEPRRVRVALSKIAAGAVVAFLSAIGIQILLSGALIPAAVFRGTTEGLSASWLADAVGIGVRVAVLAAFASSFGAALALVARNTAFAIGISFLWLAVLEGIVRGTRPGWTRWLLGDNATAFVGTDPGTHVRSGLGAAVMLSLYLLGLASIAVTSFRRRDVA